MILMTSVIAGLLVALASGGSFAAFRTLRLRWLPLLFAAVLTQIVIFTYIAGQHGFVKHYGPYIHIATLLATLAVMARNLHIPGMKVIMLGAALNALVIICNGGYMPSPEARLASAGKLVKVDKAESGSADAVLSNSKTVPNGTGYFVDGDAPLLVLGDIFDVPKGWPFANVFSIGDVLIGVGAGIAIVRVMRTRPRGASEANGAAPELREAGDVVM